MTSSKNVDVLCIGHASYDLIFSVPHHPDEDEKIFANSFFGCGGGPAANAAVAVSLLGFESAFSGYLGKDLYGEKHWQEFIHYNVDTSLIVRGQYPTPLSAILVKPDGKRALINYKGDTKPLPSKSVDFALIKPKAILFDGHETYISIPIAEYARNNGIPTILDAGSLHEGTEALKDQVDYLVCSEKFARQFAGNNEKALIQLAKISPAVVITLGEKGLIWKRGETRGELSTFPVTAIDTTGAGDAFHGAFAAAVASDMAWIDTLYYASAAGSLCCTKIGARPGLPSYEEHLVLFNQRNQGRAI